MTNVRILEAKSEHAVDACEVLIRSIKEICAPDYNNDEKILSEWLENKTPKNIREWIESPSNYSVVASTDEGNIVGFALITNNEVMLNYILPEYLYKGIGKLMLISLETYALEQGHTTISAKSSITAKEFYVRNGFISSGEPEYVGDILGDFPMIKTLTHNQSLQRTRDKTARH